MLVGCYATDVCTCVLNADNHKTVTNRIFICFRIVGENVMPIRLNRADVIQKSVLEQQRMQINEQNKTIDVSLTVIPNV